MCSRVSCSKGVKIYDFHVQVHGAVKSTLKGQVTPTERTSDGKFEHGPLEDFMPPCALHSLGTLLRQTSSETFGAGILGQRPGLAAITKVPPEGWLQWVALPGSELVSGRATDGPGGGGCFHTAL